MLDRVQSSHLKIVILLVLRLCWYQSTEGACHSLTLYKLQRSVVLVISEINGIVLSFSQIFAPLPPKDIS